MNENFFADSFLFLFRILCYFEIMMHCEIIDRYFNVFVEIKIKQKNLKSAFWAPKPVHRSSKWPEYVTAEFWDGCSHTCPFMPKFG